MRANQQQSKWALGFSLIALTSLLGGCAQGDEHPVPEEQVDAGWSRLSVKAKCEPPNLWHLASHFKLAREVDYISDRDDSGAVISEHGEACKGARNRGKCESELAIPGFSRHLVTSDGDEVRVWQAGVVTLLGDIDTPEEAIWLVLNHDINVDCDTRVFDTQDGGYSVDGDSHEPGCPSEHEFYEVNVSRDGLVSGGTALKTVGGRTFDCPTQR